MPSPDAFAGNINKGSSYRSACTECQRRKQKCNREWPCNHCQKRKVADRCHFKDSSLSIPAKAVEESRRKRRLEEDHDDDSESDDSSHSDGIDALGYMPTHILYGLTSQNEQPSKAPSREYVRSARTFPQLERALHVIPPRPYTDTLVQAFLNNANYHYYIIYPPSFLDQYHKWWTNRDANRPLCIQWTCLLLMVCACASQNTDFDLKRKLELDLGEPPQMLSEQYHEAARELGGAIPLGYSHLINVQQLLHSCYWFKSEARFQECWHVLNSAVREAQELAMNKESPDDAISEFDLEIRRRIWCVLDTWDWQISALLGRPMIIDRADCNVGLPSLTLEGMIHNPLTHIKLQSALIRKLFGRFGLTKNVVTPRDVQEYQYIIETWMKTFPPPLDVHRPDQSLDSSYPWLILHRHYIRTTAFSMLLDPIRVYLARAFTIDSTDAELKIRSDGINYCLELMVSLHGFFEYVYPWDSKFHYVLFCIFDTSTVLCSAVLHDEHHTLPRRDDVFRAIDQAHAMLQRLSTATKSAKTSYGILSRIVQRLPRTVVLPKSPENDAARRPRVSEVPISPPMVSPHYVSPQSFSSPMVTPPGPSVMAEVSSAPGDAFGYDAYAMAAPFDYTEWQPQIHSPIAPAPVVMHMPPAMVESQYLSPGPEGYQDGSYGSFAHIPDRDLGELASFWNYSSLDFEFFPPQLQM